MKITILSIFPTMFNDFIETSIVKKAVLKNYASIELVDIRKFTQDTHNRVDDYPFGGGNGMILQYQPVISALNTVVKPTSRVIMMTPSGRTLKQSIVRELSNYTDIVLICGHYEGYDERILEHVDEVISIGDYILTGGELAAMVLTDALVRLVPGVIKEDSHLEESFETGLLEHPQYTRPASIEGLDVPEVLMSGHHKNIDKYRLKESFKKTLKYKPELINVYKFSKEDLEIYKEALIEYNKDK